MIRRANIEDAARALALAAGVSIAATIIGVTMSAALATRAAAQVAPPARFIGGRLICARNVNAALAARGIAGSGSNQAGSFRRWGRPSGPVPWAVAIYRCCGPTGHVAIVDHVDAGGRVWVWNPSRRHGWQLGPHRGTATYRVPR